MKTDRKGPYNELANLAEYDMRVHLFPNPAFISPCLIALTLPSIMSLGATQCAPAFAYATATSAIRATDGSGRIVPSVLSNPQWPWSVYSQRHTSHTMKREGKISRSFWTVRMTGPLGSSAA